MCCAAHSVLRKNYPARNASKRQNSVQKNYAQNNSANIIFFRIVTPGRVVEINKKNYVHTLTPLEKVNTFTVLDQVLFVEFL